MVDTSITEEEIKNVFLDDRYTSYWKHHEQSYNDWNVKPTEEETNYYHAANRALEIFIEQVAYSCARELMKHDELNGKQAWYKNTWKAAVEVCEPVVSDIDFIRIIMRDGCEPWKRGEIMINAEVKTNVVNELPMYAYKRDNVYLGTESGPNYAWKDGVPNYGKVVNLKNTRIDGGFIKDYQPPRPTFAQILSAVENAEKTIEEICAIRHKYAVMITELEREFHAEADPIVDSAANLLSSSMDCGKYRERIRTAATGKELEYEIKYRVR